MFRIWILLARWGMFRYRGLRGHHPRWWPEARVRYPECEGVSAKMAIGNAVEYAELFHGEVVKPG
jgi:hypothetical protein